MQLVYQLDTGTGRFLEEHEMLDDRERDRDFFVGARGLSRLLENSESSHAIIKLAGEKMLSFLTDRERRWKLRVARLNHPEALKLAKKVLNEHPFAKAISKTLQESTTQKNQNRNSLQTLSEAVSSYRQWIDELEAQEDKDRENLEKQRQKSLVSARDELQELQRRQLEVSKQMHRADSRTQDELAKDWTIARMHENTNISAAGKLEEKLNALTPHSAERLSAAVEAMKLTLENGNEADYVHAETFADLAGRLLHQASKMTQEEEQQKTRRDHRNSGDNYYGQAIIGGDIETEHEYHVDPRYREEVLDEVIKSDYQGDNRTLLNNFLKRIIR